MDSVIPPDILRWARGMRDVFGTGVKLYKGVRWPVQPAPERARR